jgi:hypothetical protein
LHHLCVCVTSVSLRADALCVRSVCFATGKRKTRGQGTAARAVGLPDAC